MWSTKCLPIESSMQLAVAGDDDRKVEKYEFKMALLHRHHRCKVMPQFKAEGGNEWTESLQRVTQVIRRDVRAVAIKLWRMANKSLVNVCTDHRFVSVMK